MDGTAQWTTLRLPRGYPEATLRLPRGYPQPGKAGKKQKLGKQKAERGREEGERFPM